MKKEVFYGEENPVEEKECVEERKETDKKQEDNQEVEEKKNEEIRDFGLPPGVCWSWRACAPPASSPWAIPSSGKTVPAARRRRSCCPSDKTIIR